MRQQTIRRAVYQYETPEVLTQLLTRVNHALVSSRLGPFDVFPVMLTSRHHMLIHHYISFQIILSERSFLANKHYLY